MNISSVSGVSGNISIPATQNTQETEEVKKAVPDKSNNQDDSGLSAAKTVQQTQSTAGLNTSGQLVGQLINTQA
ncbi:hypothetical protein [Undibacterium griseum]|uniref:Uncharacterized protein n=1 Tax=Undibacterium griseum TaxID=2762295 RepID=A0ABR6YQS0_9BURK|nr:hypothetical protein [Undibacterium griseum]MBC3886252.1 hypothetical protein [Undibacterium griseum]